MRLPKTLLYLFLAGVPVLLGSCLNTPPPGWRDRLYVLITGGGGAFQADDCATSGPCFTTVEIVRLDGNVHTKYWAGFTIPNAFSSSFEVRTPGDRIYIANQLANQLQVYSHTGTLLQTHAFAPVGTGDYPPYQVELFGESILYVSDRLGVSALDAETLAVLGRAAVDSTVYLAVSDDGSLLATTRNKSSGPSIAVIETATMTLLFDVPVSEQSCIGPLRGLTFAGPDRVLIHGGKCDRLHQFDIATRSPVTSDGIDLPAGNGGWPIRLVPPKVYIVHQSVAPSPSTNVVEANLQTLTAERIQGLVGGALTLNVDSTTIYTFRFHGLSPPRKSLSAYHIPSDLVVDSVYLFADTLGFVRDMEAIRDPNYPG